MLAQKIHIQIKGSAYVFIFLRLF